MKTRTILFLSTATLAGVTWGGPALAQVCNDIPMQIAQTDADMGSVFPCAARPAAIAAMQNDFNMANSVWGNAGLSTPCLLTTSVAKMLNAGTLTTAGVSFARDPSAPIQSTHSTGFPTGDYSVLTFAFEVVEQHDDFTLQLVNTIPAPSGQITTAQYNQQPTSTDNIQVDCALFDPGAQFGRIVQANPVIRAATYVHEAWHAWEHEAGVEINNGSNGCGHQLCPGDGHPTSGACNSGAECDTWTPHGLGPAGSMFGEMHRPYQAMVEFMCDIANTPSELVPTSVRELAATDADLTGVNDFANGPMPACMAFDFGLHIGTCSDATKQCDQSQPCTDPSEGCDPQSGCCVPIMLGGGPGGTGSGPTVVPGAQGSQTGPVICAQISGFMPNEPLAVELKNIPGTPTFPNPFILTGYTADATGALYWVDGEWDETPQSCSTMEQFGSVTIVATGVISGATAQGTVPNGYFCDTLHGEFGTVCH